MSDQPALYRGVPPTSDDRPWRLIWADGSGEMVDALPVEPVGTLTVLSQGLLTSPHIEGAPRTYLPPGEHLIVAKEERR